MHIIRPKINKAKKAKQDFEGRWRITWMDQWDQEYVDEEVEGFIEFEPTLWQLLHSHVIQDQKIGLQILGLR